MEVTLIIWIFSIHKNEKIFHFIKVRVKKFYEAFKRIVPSFCMDVYYINVMALTEAAMDISEILTLYNECIDLRIYSQLFKNVWKNVFKIVTTKHKSDIFIYENYRPI